MNVILRRLESETAGVLSGIIAAIDTNYNLELLLCSNEPVTCFWIEAFKHKIISDVVKQQHFATIENRFDLYQISFVCSFPFSVFFQDSLETRWRLKLSNFGECQKPLILCIKLLL